MESEDYVFLWKWRRYLLLLATLVASVTYVAGLNPPGGVWPDDENEDHRIGDPVLPVTYHPRYTAFFYCNAAAFVASLVIIMVLLDRRVSGTRVGLTVLRSAMVLDLLALMGAYAAGSCRDVLASVYVSVLFAVVFAYVALHILVATSALPPVEWLRASLRELTEKLEELLKKGDTDQDESRVEEDHQERRKFLLLLATFATPLTYGAGLAPPGGFWDKSEHGHRAGVPVLHDGLYVRRYRAFFYCNATSFVASLAIIMLLMSRTLSGRVARSYALQVCVMVELLGLMGAYAAGSCRKVETTVYVVSLAGAVLLYIALQVAIGMFAMGTIKKWLVGLCKILQCRRNMEQEQLHVANRDEAVRVEYVEMKPNPATPNTRSDAPEEDVTGVDGNEGDADTVEESRSLLLLLATLAATVTYQAGLSPPGGFWPEDGEDHRAGDPILLQMHPKRYKAFFHCNTAAFVASLVVIVIVQSKQLSSGAVVKRRALQAAMILDLFGLMGAYAAGSCRDLATTIYVSSLAVAVFAYSTANVVAFTTLGQRRESKLMLWVDGTVQKVLKKLQLSDGQSETDDNLERKRKFLLQLAILAATVTYQSGLTPPGGFWPESNNFSHAGDPVLLDHYPNRYLVFFYCNATGFMASVAVVLLLVNRRLYKQGIRCNALHACVMVGLLGLMGAYAAGSCRKLRTSIYVFALVAAVIAFLVLQILVFVFARYVVLPTLKYQLPPWLPRLFEPLSPPPRKPGEHRSKDSGQHTEQYMKRKYLMLLGILAASVTYQAGLAPPGGTWGDNDKGYVPGNPILRDTYRPRYHAFFHCNATSFVSSVVVIVLLLQRTVKRHRATLWAMQTAVVLDLLGLLGAYAAGSCRELETSAYVIALVVVVVVYITLHVVLSFDAVARKAEKLKVWKYCGGSTDQLSGNGADV